MSSHICRVGKPYNGPVHTLAEVEHAAIINALQKYATKRSAARALGVTEKTLYNKLVTYRKRGWPTA